tara:strand:+ start:34 stop:204 length:171 start_codon:yes stop_codon:yes gene_type:complete
VYHDSPECKITLHFEDGTPVFTMVGQPSDALQDEWDDYAFSFPADRIIWRYPQARA